MSSNSLSTPVSLKAPMSSVKSADPILKSFYSMPFTVSSQLIDKPRTFSFSIEHPRSNLATTW